MVAVVDVVSDDAEVDEDDGSTLGAIAATNSVMGIAGSTGGARR